MVPDMVPGRYYERRVPNFAVLLASPQGIPFHRGVPRPDVAFSGRDSHSG